MFQTKSSLFNACSIILTIAALSACEGEKTGASSASSNNSAASAPCAVVDTSEFKSPLDFSGITSVTGVSGAMATLHWTDIAGAANYHVFNVKSGTPVFVKSVAAPASQVVLTGLTPATEFEFRVYMLDDRGRVGINKQTVKVTTSAVIDPRDIGSLALLLDAGDLDGNDSNNSLHANGSAVTQWNDKSGANLSAIQLDAGKQPILASAAIHGKAAVSFDGVNAYLGLAISNLSQSPYTMAVVFQSVASAGSMLTVVAPVIETASSHDRQFGLQGGKLAHRMWSDQTTASNTSFNDGAPHIGIVVVGPTGNQLYVDGQLVGSGTKTGSDFNWETGIVIGKHNYWGAYNGYLSAAVIYNQALSSSDRAKLEQYLSAKYGI